MKKLFIYFGLTDHDDFPLFMHYTEHSVDNIDMTAFTQWCQELGVSQMAPKNNEFTVTIGDRVKHVKLERI